MTRLTTTMQKQAKKISISILCAANLSLGMLTGCGDRISSHGHIINESELKQISISKTTRAEILNMLGRPSFEGAFDTQKLYYSSQIMLQPVASAKQTKQRVIYIFTFNDKNILDSIDLIDKDDGMSIAHIDDKTPTPGDKFGVLEQVFSNIKRRKTDPDPKLGN